MTSTDNGTSDLVRAARDGDRWAQRELVERYSGLVWSTVRSFRLGDADAHDAVQNTWLRMIEQLGAVRDAERLGGWLVTTARRECLKILRQCRREVVGLEPGEYERADEGSPSPERSAIDQSMNALLWEHVAELPVPDRRVLVALTAGEKVCYADFARATGMPVGSIGPTRMRYLDKLRRRLEEVGLGAQAWR